MEDIAYKECVEKFDNCRACLARVAEKLGLKVNPPDDYKTDWHEWLIYQLDSWCETKKQVLKIYFVLVVKNWLLRNYKGALSIADNHTVLKITLHP